MRDPLLQFVRQHKLFSAGDRVGMAVSGGADSVALLRVLLELRSELGIVLSVVHFHHGIRGAEADADEEFVRQLAGEHGLGDALFVEHGDAPAHAKAGKQSLETAARELRHRFFAQLVAERKLDKIATAHTLNDQAETVLMRLVRGAGTRGLAGIYPEQTEQAIVRPLLRVHRQEVEEYLRSLGQEWREDASNQDRQHMRNRVRHELVPAMQRLNPGVLESLGRLADIARDEEAYWDEQVSRSLPMLL